MVMENRPVDPGSIQRRNDIGILVTRVNDWDVRTHARRVCMPLCTARCAMKQSLATTRYPCASLVEVESTLSYRVLCKD